MIHSWPHLERPCDHHLNAFGFGRLLGRTDMPKLSWLNRPTNTARQMGQEMGTIEFWFSIGSNYSYLSVMRLSKVTKEVKIEFRWRPFNVRRVMVEQNNIPFKDKPE
jgi:hypothetical protein